MTAADRERTRNFVGRFLGGLAVFVPLATTAILLSACTSAPRGVTPVTGLDIDRYLGTWHEVARLDHRFERGLSQVTAEYSRRDDGRIRVVNRGFDEASGKWSQVEGKARFRGDPQVGSLEVSFFGPFYGGYHIIALDRADYRWAMVSGPSRDYLWILARSADLSPDVVQPLLDQAHELGFAVTELIWLSEASRPRPVSDPGDPAP